MLTLNDGRNELWQWDTGRKMNVDAECSQVHFSNKVFGRSVDVDVVGGIAIIPDFLLQTDKDILAWAYVGSPENGYTKISKVFKVNRRNKPSEYVFTPVDQMTMAEISAIAQSVRDDADAGLFNGEDGATFIPSVSSDGVISWTNDKELPNPDPVNIKGKDGQDGYTPVKGVDYFDGDKGDKGDTGAKGTDGVTPEFSIGNVTTLDAGSNATATITGTAERPVLNLGIPKGADGASGSGEAGGTTVQSDWLQNDATAPDYIKNKPFGVTGGRNTITIADNLVGFQNAGLDEWFKVSDAVVTMDDINAESDIAWFSCGGFWSAVQNGQSLVDFISQGEDGINVWAVDMDMGNTYIVAQFRSNGVYFCKADATADGSSWPVYPVSITIAHSGKFPVSKPIDTEYLPESLRFGEVSGSSTWTRESDTIEKATDVLVDWTGGQFKISDAVVTLDDLSLGFKFHYRDWDGTIYENDYGEGRDQLPLHFGYYQNEDGSINLVYNDEYGNSMNAGVLVPEGHAHDPGIYVNCYREGEMECGLVDLTINGFDKFTSSVPIDKKYLPDDIGGMPEVTADDNGKFLRVVDGAWAAVAVPNAEGVGF